MNDDAKKAAAAKADVIFDQKKCVFEPHVLGSWRRRDHAQVERPVNHNVNAKLKNSRSTQMLAAGRAWRVHSQRLPNAHPAR